MWIVGWGSVPVARDHLPRQETVTYSATPLPGPGAADRHYGQPGHPAA